MPFRDPVYRLILPPGSTPPTVGQTIIVLDPGPPPAIQLYTGDADETQPGQILATVDGVGQPQLVLQGPETTDGSSAIFLGETSQSPPAGSDPGAPFIVMQANDYEINDTLDNQLIRGFGIGSAFTDPYGSVGSLNSPLTVYSMAMVPAGFRSSATPMVAIQDTNTSAFNTLTNTAFAATSTPCALTFVAPPSGRGLIICRARLTLITTANVSRDCRGTPWIGTGSTLNAGTAVATDGVTPPSDSLEFVHQENFQAVIGSAGMVGSGVYLMETLTPGDSYNIALRHRINNATSASYNVLSQFIQWVPLY